MNPNKEERIQKLETTLEITTEKVEELEKRLDSLEIIKICTVICPYAL